MEHLGEKVPEVKHKGSSKGRPLGLTQGRYTQEFHEDRLPFNLGEAAVLWSPPSLPNASYVLGLAADS